MSIQEIPGSMKWNDPTAQLAYETGLQHGKAMALEQQSDTTPQQVAFPQDEAGLKALVSTQGKTE